jgi:hypothetical protein
LAGLLLEGCSQRWACSDGCSVSEEHLLRGCEAINSTSHTLSAYARSELRQKDLPLQHLSSLDGYKAAGLLSVRMNLCFIKADQIDVECVHTSDYASLRQVIAQLRLGREHAWTASQRMERVLFLGLCDCAKATGGCHTQSVEWWRFRAYIASLPHV